MISKRIRNHHLGLLLAILSFLSLIKVYNSESDEGSDEHKTPKCGYSTCPTIKEGLLNVHLVAHSHDDLGWLKTVDGYYYGNEGKHDGVQDILSSVVQALSKNPSRRFIYAEMGFFWKWWQQQTEKSRELVKQLVDEGRLEFVGGGWAQHDEAVTHYQSILDQLTWGLRKLSDLFGQCGMPRVGWQIDPFGHSRESAAIMAQVGFDGMFFSRNDINDKKIRNAHKTLEMVWESSPNLGENTDLFVSILYDTYDSPKGFNYDISSFQQIIVDDEHSPEYNADKLAEEFEAHVHRVARVYKSERNIMIVIGSDFGFKDAVFGFDNIDKLIRVVNERQHTHNNMINLLYSTPSCYLRALHDEKLQWPTKQDDFFPYSSDNYCFWSGYYTSRPSLKFYERLGNNFLQVCKQIQSLSNLESGPEASGLDVMREAMGILQHHDAITGTQRQVVSSDHARLLSEGFDKCGSITQSALSKLMSKTVTSPPLAISSCLLLNISECDISENYNTFVVTLYNPLSHKVSRYVRLPVTQASYSVQGPQGKPVTVQIVPVPEPVSRLPGRRSRATLELVFHAVDLPPLGFQSYYVSHTNNAQSDDIKPIPVRGRELNKEFIIGFPNSLRLTVDSRLGLPSHLQMPGLSTGFSFTQSFHYYLGTGWHGGSRPSGAYVFRSSTDEKMVPDPSIKYYKGPLVQELHQEFSPWVSQVIRAYEGEGHLEFNWIVGPIPTDDGIDKEVVSRYTVHGMVSNKTFYTDSNGREMVKRVKDYRPTYKEHIQEHISGNYYPVTTRISLRDNEKTVSVITDRAQGGTSMHDGEIELMVHRRLLSDDSQGLGEALNEKAYGQGLVARGTHYLTGGPADSQGAVDRRLVQERVLAAWTFLTPTALTLTQWQADYIMEYSGLKTALPENVQILTLEPWKDSSFLLRLEHILEKTDENTAAQPVVVNLLEIFKPFSVTKAWETSLGANEELGQVSRLVWSKEGQPGVDSPPRGQFASQNLPVVHLSPMEIKTFLINISFED